MAQPDRRPGVDLIDPPVRSNPWVVLLVLTLGFFMILLDTTIVNIAVPDIEKGLNTSFDQILWILNAYLLVYAVLLISAGRMGDIFGPKRLFVLGLVVFTVASALCGLSQNPGELIAFRVLQGVGGATLTPQTLAVITSIFPPARRGAAFGIWGAVGGVAAVVGPTLGGFLVTSASWRWIFYVNVPVGVMAVVAALLLMPEIRSHRRHELDLVGVALASSSLFLGVFALIEGQRFDSGPIVSWASFSVAGMRWAPVSVYSLLVYSLVVMAVFVIRERNTREPILPLSLFRDRNYSIANAASASVSYGMLAIFLPLTIYYQSVLGFTAVHAGLTFIPMSAAALITAPFAGRLTDRINGKYVLMFGATCFALGIGLVIAVLSLSATSWTFVIPMTVGGVGMGFTFAPMVTLAMRDVEPSMAGSASGFLNTIRQVGQAMGGAIGGAILSNSFATDLVAQARSAATSLPAATRSGFVATFRALAKKPASFGVSQSRSIRVPPSVPPALRPRMITTGTHVFKEAFVQGMRPTMISAVVLLLFAAVLASSMRSTAATASRERSTTVEAAG